MFTELSKPASEEKKQNLGRVHARQSPPALCKAANIKQTINCGQVMGCIQTNPTDPHYSG